MIKNMRLFYLVDNRESLHQVKAVAGPFYTRQDAHQENIKMNLVYAIAELHTHVEIL
jgi:hypothetical protein